VQILWVLDHIRDLECDFSAIHRISDMYSLPAPLFFQFAARMSCYQGVMKVLLEKEIQEQEGSGSGRDTAVGNSQMVQSDPLSLQANFGDIMEVAEG
jgi:hypothetical protein